MSYTILNCFSHKEYIFVLGREDKGFWPFTSYRYFKAFTLDGGKVFYDLDTSEALFLYHQLEHYRINRGHSVRIQEARRAFNEACNEKV